MHRGSFPSQACACCQSLFISTAHQFTTRLAVPSPPVARWRSLALCRFFLRFSTAWSRAKYDLRSGSEPSRQIDLRGMLDARAQCVSLRLIGDCRPPWVRMLSFAPWATSRSIIFGSWAKQIGV